MIAYHLTSEHMKDPTGIDRNHPQLSWKCAGGLCQSAYQIRSASAPEDLNGDKLIWDSGEILSDESLNIEYPAEAGTGDRVYWQVRLKDEQQECGWTLEDGAFTLELSVPSNTTAQIRLPENVSRVTDPCGLSFAREGGSYAARAYAGTYRIVCSM